MVWHFIIDYCDVGGFYIKTPDCAINIDFTPRWMRTTTTGGY
jgi:hypothetical protein